ncbi:MAG: AIR synthase related protein, partial [Verrucomicrobiae bacterium]|nr:AIR synthase related protein [Verrucomicrobiae bacterium]
MKKDSFRNGLSWLAAIFVAMHLPDVAGEPGAGIHPKSVGLEGGLVVQLGADDMTTPVELSRTGRYLVHVLDPDPAVVARARTRLRARGYYGLASVEHAADLRRLPYTENLVNLVVVRNFTAPAAEILRVLAPKGSVIVASPKTLTKGQLRSAGFALIRDLPSANGPPMIAARKPWPKEMDVEWLDEFFAGFAALARESGTALLGGDTTGTPQPIIVNVAVIGYA